MCRGVADKESISGYVCESDVPALVWSYRQRGVMQSTVVKQEIE